MIDRLVFTLLIVGLMIAMIIGSFNYAGTAAFGFPFTVGLIVLVMALAVLVCDLQAWRGRDTTHATAADPAELPTGAGAEPDAAPEAPEVPERARNWTGVAVIYLFLIGFLVVTITVSYLVATPLFLFLIVFLFCREGILRSALIAIGVSIPIYLVFGQVLYAF